MDAKASFLKRFLRDSSDVPFSFVYGGTKSDEFLRNWDRTTESTELDATRRLHGITYKDSETNFEVRCHATEYLDFPVVEWVVYLRNGGAVDSPMIENIQALDTHFTRNDDVEFVLHHMRGSFARKEDFAPMRDTLNPLSSKRLSCVGGRSSNGGDKTREDGAFPFFNLACDEGGVIAAIGWSGQWAAEFTRDKDRDLKVTAGMEGTHLRLLAGEEIRTPRISMFFWKGEKAEAHNEYRKFILKHHTPLRGDQPLSCPVATNTWFKHDYGSGVTEENQIEVLKQLVENKIDVEYFWIDAGWYEDAGTWYKGVGNWFPKKKAFPRGLKPVADEARKHGMGFVLWFEPERVYPGTWLFEAHPEWLIMPTDGTMQQQVSALLDLGNPEARRWVTDHVSSMIREVGIDIYRQDFNFDPLAYWRSADAPDRQGISEIRYIEGLYAFWDELRRRHPDLIIDNCASGGRRIDLETISRSVALWRTDYGFEPEGHQCHTMGLNQYVPCSAMGCNATDAYVFRSSLSNGITLCWDVDAEDFNPGEARQRIREFKMLRPLFHGDFYALTTHNTAPDVWCAYQLERRDLNRGAVLVFRRKDSPYCAARFKLCGLDPEATYELTDLDTGIKQTFSGRELMETGLEVEMAAAPCSVIITYGRISAAP